MLQKKTYIFKFNLSWASSVHIISKTTAVSLITPRHILLFWQNWRAINNELQTNISGTRWRCVRLWRSNALQWVTMSWNVYVLPTPPAYKRQSNKTALSASSATLTRHSIKIQPFLINKRNQNNLTLTKKNKIYKRNQNHLNLSKSVYRIKIILHQH